MGFHGVDGLLFMIKHHDTEWSSFYEVRTIVYEKYAVVSVVRRAKADHAIMSWPIKQKIVYKIFGMNIINRIEKTKLKMQKYADKKNTSVEFLKMINEVV